MEEGCDRDDMVILSCRGSSSLPPLHCGLENRDQLSLVVLYRRLYFPDRDGFNKPLEGSPRITSV